MTSKILHLRGERDVALRKSKLASDSLEKAAPRNNFNIIRNKVVSSRWVFLITSFYHLSSFHLPWRKGQLQAFLSSSLQSLSSIHSVFSKFPKLFPWSSTPSLITRSDVFPIHDFQWPGKFQKFQNRNLTGSSLIKKLQKTHEHDYYSFLP